MVDGEEMLAIHRDNDGVPNLRYQHLPRHVLGISTQKHSGTYLRLILYFHVSVRQKFRVNALWQASEDILPGRPYGKTNCEGPPNADDRVPDDIPKEGIEEEQRQIHKIHDSQRERSMVPAKRVAEESIVAALNFHSHHDTNWITERRSQEEVGLDEFAGEDENP